MSITLVSLEAVTNIEKHLQLEKDLGKGSEYDSLYFQKLNALEQNVKPSPEDDTEEDVTDDTSEDDSLDSGDSTDSLEESEEPTEGEDIPGEDTDAEDSGGEDSTTEDTTSESVAKECIGTLHTTSRLKEIQAKLLPGFSLEDVSELQFNKEMADDLTYLSESSEKISQIMKDYIKGRFTTYNSYLEKALRARQVVSLNEKIEKVKIAKDDADSEEADIENKVDQSQAELEVGMDVSIKATYKNELFVSQLKIGNSLEFDKNFTVANEFLKIAITNYSVALNRSIKKIRNNIASSSDKVDPLVLPIPKFDGLEKKELVGYESSGGLSSYVYKEMLPGDMVFITYAVDGDSKAKLKTLEGCKSIFGINSKEIAKVRFSPLLEDKDRLISYLDIIESLVRFGKKALKYIYELSTSDLAELSRAFLQFKKAYDTKYVQTTVRDSQMLNLVSHSDFIARYTILTLLLLHDYLSRVVEASLDFIKESLTEQD